MWAQDSSAVRTSAWQLESGMRNMQCIDPIVGDWYRSHGQLFEVVALDEHERVVEVQHADGDLEEIDLDDWATRCRAGSLSQADAPEDARLATDREDESDYWGHEPQRTVEEARGLRADALDLDLFE
jgi:hypothetical protein